MSEYSVQSDVFSIESNRVGAGYPSFIIAEIAQAHDGSLGSAHAYIDAAASAKVDAVKFQTHIADAESTPEEPWRIRFSPQDASRFDYWKRMEFTAEQWRGLKEHSNNVGLVFLSSPFSLEAADLLQQIGMPAWKIGSGEITNFPLLERAGTSGVPVLLSSGMASWQELDAAVAFLRKMCCPIAVMQCTSSYPVPPEKLGLNLIQLLRARYECPVGLSDHSGSLYSGIAAVTLGASILESHLTFSKRSFGPDASSSLTVEEFSEMVKAVRFVERALYSGVDKDSEALELQQTRRIFMKVLVAARDLASGTVIARGDFLLRKAGDGLPASQMEAILGKRLRRTLNRHEKVQADDIID